MRYFVRRLTKLIASGVFLVASSASAVQLYAINEENRIYTYARDTWVEIDNTGNTKMLAGSRNRLYQLNDAGEILEYNFTPCMLEICPGWILIDNNAATKKIVVDNSRGTLYQMHRNGSIFRYTGRRCEETGCRGWERLDNNTRGRDIAAGGGHLYQMHDSGEIWRSTGAACDPDWCRGWDRIDNDPNNVEISAGNQGLIKRGASGHIWRFVGQPCAGTLCSGWQRLDNNSQTSAIISAERGVYQKHRSGAIWRYTGTPCLGDSCLGWEHLDDNGATFQIAAEGGHLYQIHNSGSIYRFTGDPCTADAGCRGWTYLNSRDVAVGSTGAFTTRMDGAYPSLYVFGHRNRSEKEKAIDFCQFRMGEELLECDVQSGVCRVGMITIKRFTDGPRGYRNHRACRDKQGAERLKRLGNALAPVVAGHATFNYASYRSWMRVIENHAGPKYALPRETRRALQPYFQGINLGTVRFAHTTSKLAGDGNACITDCKTIYCTADPTVQAWRAGSIQNLLIHELEHTAQCQRWGGRTLYALRWFRNMDVGLLRSLRASGGSSTTKWATRVHDALPMEEKAQEKADNTCADSGLC